MLVACVANVILVYQAKDNDDLQTDCINKAALENGLKAF
jgi:hypothetical protein